MNKEETRKKIGENLDKFVSGNDVNDLATSINDLTTILQSLNIDERQKAGVDLLIGYVQGELTKGAILKVQNKYDQAAKDNVAIAVSYVMPNIVDMAIFED